MLAILDNTSAEFRLGGLLLVLLVACIAGMAFVLWVRKWVKDDSPPIRQEGGFTLSDLRALHQSGKISTEEFDRAREKIVAHARRNMPGALRPAGGNSPPPLPPDPARGRGGSAGPDAPHGGATAG